MGSSACFQCFYHTNVCIMKLRIFSYKSNIYIRPGIFPVFTHPGPLAQIGLGTLKPKCFACRLCDTFFFQSQWYLIKNIYIHVFQYSGGIYITKQSYFFFYTRLKGIISPAYYDVRLDTHALKLFYTHLSGFCLHFSGCIQIWNECYMDIYYVFMPHFMLELTYSFDKWLALNISYGSAYFYESNSGISILCLFGKESLFYLVGNMRNDLYCSSAIVTMSFFADD